MSFGRRLRLYFHGGDLEGSAPNPTVIRKQPVNAQTGTTYTVLTTDRGKLVTHTNASAIAATLPQASATFPDGWFMDVQNRGAGTVTITPTTSTIDDAASVALTTGQGMRIFSDGTNYFTQRGVGGTIADDSVTYAKMQNISAASRVLGRGSAGGSGDPQEITLGSGLTMSGTTLTSNGSGGAAIVIVGAALGLVEMARGTNYQM